MDAFVHRTTGIGIGYLPVCWAGIQSLCAKIQGESAGRPRKKLADYSKKSVINTTRHSPDWRKKILWPHAWRRWFIAMQIHASRRQTGSQFFRMQLQPIRPLSQRLNRPHRQSTYPLAAPRIPEPNRPTGRNGQNH